MAMTKGLQTALALLSLTAATSFAATPGGKVIFYVATNGNDAWSGELAAPNAAKTDGPFASITRARDALRELKAAGPVPPLTFAMVRIRGGTYYLPETIVFTPEDSGTKECPITYAAFPGEKPILSGGRRLTGFKPWRGKILSVDLPDVKAGKWYFRQLFIDDERQIRARYPNFDPADPYRGGFLYVDRAAGGYGRAVGNIHNPGDWMEYKVGVPADGEYSFWMYYGADNAFFGTTDMGGHTVLIVDGGAPVTLNNLPDTGGWGVIKWSRCASVNLTKGEHVLRWQNVTGGGLNLVAYALGDDPNWKPSAPDLPKAPAAGHMILIQAEDFVRCQGKQLSLGGGSGSPTQFRYKAGQFKASWADHPDAEVHIWPSDACRAFKEILQLQKIDEATRTVTVGGKETAAILFIGDRYFVENVPEELDSPGEWYLDRQSGTLYFWPTRPLTAKSEVVAPVLGRVVDFQGDAEKGPVSYITLSGLTIRHNDYGPEDNCVGFSMGYNGTVYMNRAENCRLEDCTFRNIGKHAVLINGGSGNSIVGCEIAYGAEGGIAMYETARNTVSDCHIHHCGLIYKHIAGVVMEQNATECVVVHNLIHHMSRYGISFKSAGRDNVVEYNDLYTLDTETFDTGGIEVTQQDRNFQSGSTIRHNIVRDVLGFSSDGGHPVFLSWGIYLDSFAGGYIVTDNLCVGNNNGGIMLQGGKGNRIENNVFAESDQSQLFLSNFMDNCTDNTLEHNIVYYSSPTAALIYGGNLTHEALTCDNNLYFHAGGGDLKVGAAGIGSFAEWQQKGFDTNSLVADPLFVDPAKGNFALRPDSPAFRLGIKPIDTSQVGPRKRH
jgi:parallel beta-helix repeat protein